MGSREEEVVKDDLLVKLPYPEFLRHCIDCIRERCVQYCLEKTHGVGDLDEYRAVLKDELKRLHSHNMKNMCSDINSH